MSSVLVLSELTMMEVVLVTAAAIRHAKLQSKFITTNKPTPSFLQVGCASCRPTNSAEALKGRSITVCRLVHHKLTRGSSTPVFEHWNPLGAGFPLVSVLMPVPERHLYGANIAECRQVVGFLFSFFYGSSSFGITTSFVRYVNLQVFCPLKLERV